MRLYIAAAFVALAAVALAGELNIACDQTKCLSPTRTICDATTTQTCTNNCLNCQKRCLYTQEQFNALPVKYATLAEAAASITYINATVGWCPNGRVDSTATGTVAPVCSREFSTIPTCATGVSPTKGTDGCPTCVVRTVEVTLECAADVLASIPTCAPKTCPTKDATTRCPSCRVAWTTCSADAPVCTADQLRADGSIAPTSQCCFPCKRQECSDTQIATCRNSVSTLPICEDIGAKPVWSSTSCCYTCRPRPVDSVATACTSDAFKACLAAAPLCTSLAQATVATTDRCCPACKPPALSCTWDQAARCLATTPVCAKDVKPTIVGDSCCPSCIPPKVACAVDCRKDGKVCGKDNTCVAPEVHRVKAALVKGALVNACNSTEAEIQAGVQAIVEKYCANVAHAERCKAFGERVQGAVIRIVSRKCETGDVELSLETRPPTKDEAAAAEAAASKTKRAASDAGTFTATAMSDPAANDGTVASAVAAPVPDSGVGALAVAATAACAAAAALVL